jgi:peptidoglycan hydrolase-like protein with peptidoglycan-binding domain
MTPRQVRAAVCALLVLSGGVSVNVILLQEGSTAKEALRGGLGLGGQPANVEAQVNSSGSWSKAALASASVRELIDRGGQANNEGMATAAPLTAGDAGRPTEGDGPVAARDGAEVVHALQRELRRRGYDPGTPNGVPNLLTRAAILAYQYDHGLPLTSEPSEELLKAILFETSGAVRTLGSGSSRELSPQAEQIIRTVQQWLLALGYTVGKVDGRHSEETQRAIRKFEMEQGFPPTGRVSGQLVAHLARVAGKGRPTASR